jgi:hypothetical protein
MEQCKQVAREIHKSLPDSTHELLSHPFKGKIVTLSSGTDLASGRKEDVHNNAVFLKPCVRQWPQRVLSAYLYADIVLELDQLVAGNLLTPSRAWPRKMDLALQVGSKLKKLTSTLRQLGRRTKNSWSEEIRELKCLLETKKGGEAATLLLPGRDTEDTEGDGESPAGTEGDRDAPAGTKGDGEGEAPAGTEGDGEALAGTEGDGEAPAGTEGDGPAPAGAEAAAGMTLEDAAEVEALLEEAVEVLDEVQAESLMEMIPSIQSADELLDIVLELIDDSGVTMVTPEPRGRRLTFSPTSPDDDKPKVKQENEDMIKALFGPETDDEEDGLFQELFGSQTEPEGPLDEEGRENIPWFRVLFNKLGWWYIY